MLNRKRRFWWLAGAALLALLFAAGPGCDDGDGDGGDDPKDVEEQSPDDTVADVCKPDCTTKTCGDDGCGGSCGGCFTMEGAPDDSLCLPEGVCTECGCGERTCGPDPCGSPCGTCLDHFACSEAGACQVEPGGCSQEGYVPDSVQAKVKETDSDFVFRLVARREGASGTEFLVLDIDPGKGADAPAGPGTYDVQFKNLSGEGGLRLYGVTAGDTEPVYMVPVSGEIEIFEFSPAGGEFQAKLHDVVAVESVLVGDTGIPKYQNGGAVWCLDEVIMVADIVVVPAKCGDGPVGTDLHQTIGNFELQNCYGDWVDLYEGCGKHNALWIVATAGW